MEDNNVIIIDKAVGKEYQIPELVDLLSIKQAQALTVCTSGSGATNVCSTGSGT